MRIKFAILTHMHCLVTSWAVGFWLSIPNNLQRQTGPTSQVREGHSNLWSYSKWMAEQDLEHTCTAYWSKVDPVTHRGDSLFPAECETRNLTSGRSHYNYMATPFQGKCSLSPPCELVSHLFVHENGSMSHFLWSSLHRNEDHFQPLYSHN